LKILCFEIKAMVQTELSSEKANLLRDLFYCGQSKEGLLSEIGYTGQVQVIEYSIKLVDENMISIFTLVSVS
jgi:hypothetical protein